MFWAAQNNLSLSVWQLDHTLHKYLLHLLLEGGAAFDASYALHGFIFVRELPQANT